MPQDDAGYLAGPLQLADGKKPYLGDWQVVNSLLRTFTHRLLTMPHPDGAAFSKTAEQAARALAKTFLGQDKKYAALPWNSPGQIDAYVAKWAGVESDNPEERVAGALLTLVRELLDLAETIHTDKLLREQWTGEAGDIMHRYACMFLGIKEMQVASVLPTSISPSKLTRQ